MKKMFMAASAMVLACACQPKQEQNMQQNQQQTKPSNGGCSSCEAEKVQPLSSSNSEVKAVVPAPEVAQQQTPAPVAKTEAKAQ